MTAKAKGAEYPTGDTTAQKFALEKLRRNCRTLFGVSSSTFDGATYGLAGNYTVEEMRSHIEDWKKKEVK